MLSRRAKEAFYLAAAPLMLLNGRLYRAFRSGRAISNGPVRLHLGCGQDHYMPGWINVDANAFTAKVDLWVDLRNPLPFPENSVDAVYSHHVVEHLADIENHLKDVHRVLKPGGVYRIAGPDGDAAIRKFVEGDAAWLGDFPDKYESLGGRLNNYLLCRNEHLHILTESYVREMGRRGGFDMIDRRQPVVDTGHPRLFEDVLSPEHDGDWDVPHTIVMEMMKTA